MNQTVSKANSTDISRVNPSQAAEDPFLELLVETIETLDRPVRGQFLQRFIKAMTQVELNDTQSLDCWDQILKRRQELSETIGKPVSLKTAMVDVLAATNYLRAPILVEYEELKKLQINAATDALTGLYNRRLLEEYFSKELNRSKRYGQHLALVLMDLHRFKDVNDRHGHQQGDQTLQMAASTLRKTLRTSDFAFRIGGDEFALLLPQSDPEQAGILARRLRANYEAAIQPLKLDVPLAMDYGVAVFPEDADEREALVRLADERLYQLKNSTRVQPRVVPAPHRESNTTRDAAPPAATAPKTLVAAAAAGSAALTGSERRKWERVSMVGTRAYAVLGDDPNRTARVLDLSYGGVALQMEQPELVPQQFHAILHVPILPPVKVSLRRTYIGPQQQVEGRVGFAFVS